MKHIRANSYQAIHLFVVGSGVFRGQEDNPDFLLLNLVLRGLLDILPLLHNENAVFLTLADQLTIAGTSPISRSGVMSMDWTRNLSRHRLSGGGSSFIACNRTETSTS